MSSVAVESLELDWSELGAPPAPVIDLWEPKALPRPEANLDIEDALDESSELKQALLRYLEQPS